MSLVKSRVVILFSGARVNAILDAIEWPVSLRNIDTGDSTLQADPGTARNALEALQTVENKVDDPQQWTIADAVDAVGHTTPKEPPMCEHGMILKQGVSKGGKPYYGYVCKGSNKDHAVWAKMTAKGTFYFDGVE